MNIAEEVLHEQNKVDTFYARLDELREAAARRLATVRREGPSGSPQNRSERDAFATLYEDRIAQLNSVEERLAFGRLDFVDADRADSELADSTRYVGRIGLTDREHTPLLTDWRAPAAEPFYQATGAHDLGVRRRRHLLTKGRTVTSVEDELFDLSDGVPSGALAGEGALFAAMAAGRTGHMSDIVATIQAEQDRIIRAPLTGALVVQGGPGTGKTAVALHRAAYLLYAHRRLLERSGVLLVGPSRSFLRYIDQVLPSLGETGVVTATIGDLVPGLCATVHDAGPIAAIKGRPIWARIIARAVAARERVPAADQPIRLDGVDLAIRPGDVRAAIAKAHRTRRPHNQTRVAFVREMLARLADQYEQGARRSLDADERAVVLEDLRTDRRVRIALNLAWLPITPQRLIEDLFTKPHRLAQAAPELPAADRAALARPKDAPWTVEDVPLLDEAAELLGDDDEVARAEARAGAAQRAADVTYARAVLASSGAGGGIVDAELLAERFAEPQARLTTAERAALDRTWTYAHVIVDEAQELSPMAWRMLVRRCPTRSMTIVGDVAQTSSLAGTRSWAHTLRPFLREAWREEQLTVNYRTPVAVAEAAQRVARAARLPISPLTSARDVPGSLVLVPAGGADVVAAVVREALAACAEFVTASGGQVAVIAGPTQAATIRAAVEAAVNRTNTQIEAIDVGQKEAIPMPLTVGGPNAADARLVVVTPLEAKGLEFDAVVLVEPAVIAAGDPGISDLYVAMPRPTQRLIVVHARQLPPGLAVDPDPNR